MDDFNRLATLDEIDTHYQTSDPVPINWLLNGRLDFLGDADMDVTFTKGTIESPSDNLTGTYDLIRFANGYMMYNIMFPVTLLSVPAGGSGDLFYDLELPAAFSDTPYTTVSYGREARAECYVTFDYNEDHRTEYLPTVNLYPRTTGFDTTSGFILIHMEGF